jgi:3-oxoacyl-[acyl-carrier protein] reductase
MKRLEGKVAVVTGGSRGIGRAIAESLAGEGVLVCVNYRENAGAAAEVVQTIEASGGEAFALQGDVGSAAELGRFFEGLDAGLKARRGDHHFDILVNNAGISVHGPMATATESDFDRVLQVNVKGPYFTAQHAIPRLRDGGRVINISSALSKQTRPVYSIYSMTKAALNVFTVALAAELGPRGITVNTLAPGLTATELNAKYRSQPGFEERVASMTALGRIGKVEDIAGAVLMLTLPESGWITGQYVEASGGIGLVMPG